MVFISTGLGKAAGLFHAKRVLQKALDELSAILDERQPLATSGKVTDVPKGSPHCGLT
jgi:hypothetical protein